MGKYLLCGKEAENPLEAEDLDLRLYTIEELCWYIYHDLSLLPDDFINERLIGFIERDLDLPEIADKIRRFYTSPSDFDATVQMLLSEVGYYSDAELKEFQTRVVARRRKSGPERMMERAVNLQKAGYLHAAVRVLRNLLREPLDGRMSTAFYMEVRENLADCFGYLTEFDNALEMLISVFRETGSERVLKKMYDICMLSGNERSDLFEKISEEKLNEWRRDYWSRDTMARTKVDEDPAMQIFLQPPENAKKELRLYVDSLKDEYRGMLQ